MTEATGDIRVRLDQVRHRWRQLEMVKALSVGIVEAAGLLMVFMLADWLYRFSPAVRTVLLAAGATAVVVVLLRHVVAAFARHITDEELALFVEQRNPELQGALLSATEFGEHRGTPLHNYIVDVLVREARRRIQVVDVRRTVDLSRLAKYGIACVVMLGVFVLAGALFPQFVWRQGERVLVPWRPQPD
ncbi:MAG TPA: hypothetical protein VMY39_00305, partial [Planctomycetota bacterium]|nr:hypothetical protein [Planctomycetota bacterium]